ncbi:MAG: hypothetical protein BWY82_02807 [Verrucomicrobia bacterium ADurb.Bin474]|nr:MAG: hypothetical protein BWY82_02807 [Verrucomicrobia bacterium ADurb.Bin474]
MYSVPEAEFQYHSPGASKALSVLSMKNPLSIPVSPDIAV